VARRLSSHPDAAPLMPLLTAEEVSHARTPRKLCLGLLLTLAALPHSACATGAVPTQPSPPTAKNPEATPAATPAGTDAGAEGVRVGDSLVRDDELTYEGYTVRKLFKEVREAYVPGGRAEVAYAVLERRGRVLRSFDAGVYHGGLNSVSFGLFPFLGGGARQLVVSQDAPREGAQWVVSLSPRPRVIYDGPAFEAGREADDLRVKDLDGDGVYEIVAPVCQFYGFRDLAPAAAPLPPAVFKYDAKAGKYLPANQLFREHLLKGVDEAKAKVRGPSEPGDSHLADVLSILLTYVFAGDEREGWEFYEAAYKLPDKAEVKREVKAELRSQPVYRFIYKQAAGR
jgi:hypothetical protein